MHLQQRDIIFRKFWRILRSRCYVSLARLACAGVFHSPRVAFVRCLRGRREGLEEQEKLRRRFSYREHVRAEVNFGRRMSLLKLVVFSTSFPLTLPQKKFFKHNCAHSLRTTSPHNFGPREKCGYTVFLKSPGEATQSPDFVS